MGENKQIKKVSSKRMLTMIGILAAIVVIGIGGIVFALQSTSTFKKLKGTPEEIVTAALKHTNKKILQEQETLQKQLGGQTIKEIMKQEANEVNFSFALQDISGIENADILSAYIKNLGINGTFQNTRDGSKGNGTLSMKQSGLELLSASFYKDENEVGMNIPKIFDAPYAIKLDTFATDYMHSALYQLMGGERLDEAMLEETSEMIKALGDYMTGVMSLSTNKEFMEQTLAIQEQLIQGASLTEGEKTTLTLANGKTKECRTYRGTLTSEQVVQFVKDEMNVLMNLDFVKNYFEVLAKQSGTTVEDMLEAINTLDATGDHGKLEIEFLIDDPYVVGVHITFINGDTSEEVGAFTLQYKGENDLSDAVHFEMNLPNEANTSEDMNIKFDLTQNRGEAAEQINQDVVCSITEGGKFLGSIVYSYAYEPKATENNLHVAFSIQGNDGTAINVSASGTKLIGNSEVSTQFDNVSFVISQDIENIILNFGLSYGMKAMKASDVTIDKTGVKYILDMTEDELLAEAQTIQNNVQKFTYGLLFSGSMQQ